MFSQLHRSLHAEENSLTENGVSRCQSMLSVIFSAAFSVYVETLSDVICQIPYKSRPIKSHPISVATALTVASM